MACGKRNFYRASHTKSSFATGMALQLSWALAKKFAANCIPYGGSTTERIDEPLMSQKIKFFCAPDVVFTDPDTQSTILIGSGFNVSGVSMKPGQYDLVINCALSEVPKIVHPRLIQLDLKDDNNQDLDFLTMEKVVQEAGAVLALPEQKVLVNCWMGASRSTSVAIYICCRLYGATLDPDQDWEYFYDQFKKARPSIAGSVRLRSEVLRLLEQADGCEVVVPQAPSVVREQEAAKSVSGSGDVEESKGDVEAETEAGETEEE